MAAISLPTGSPVRRFRTVAASAKEGVKFVVGGDTGSTPASRQMMATAAARSPDFAVHGKQPPRSQPVRTLSLALGGKPR